MKKIILLSVVLIFSGCMGMMMHGTNHSHNTVETMEEKNTAALETTADSTTRGTLQRASTHETQKAHHEENPKKKSILTKGGIGMIILMTIMMAAKFI